MSGIYLTWAADVARRAVAGTSCRVIEVAGWATRGHGGYRVVEGIVGHHTGGPKLGDYPSLNVVTNGRADLAGPLCTYGLARSGDIYVVAAGVAWHAGASASAGFTDLNDEYGGVEAESTGGGDWSPPQLVIYPRLIAEFLRQIRRGPERYVSHRTCALPAGRKPDPTGIADQWMRDRVAALLGGAAPIPAPAPAPLPAAALEDDVSPVPIPVTVLPDGTFALSARVESTATGSQLYKQMWIRYGPLWCDAADVRIGAQDGKGGMIGTLSTPVAIKGNVDTGYQVPPLAKCITIEGRLIGTDPKRQMSAWLLAKPVPA